MRDLQAERDFARSGTIDTLRPTALEVSEPSPDALSTESVAAPPSPRAAWVTALAGTLVLGLVCGSVALTARPESASKASGSAAPRAPTALTPAMAAPAPMALTPGAVSTAEVVPSTLPSTADAVPVADQTVAAAGARAALSPDEAAAATAAAASPEGTNPGDALHRKRKTRKAPRGATAGASSATGASAAAAATTRPTAASRAAAPTRPAPAAAPSPQENEAIETLIKASAERSL